MDTGSRTFTVRGREVTHHYLRRPPVAVIAARDAEGRYLLVRQYRAALDEEIVELPAGRAESGEAIEATARRELEEETGHRAGRMAYRFSFHPTPGYSDEVVHAFEAGELRPTATRFDPSEEIELLRLSPGEVDAALRSGRIHDGKTMLTLLALQAGLRRPAPPEPGPRGR